MVRSTASLTAFGGVLLIACSDGGGAGSVGGTATSDEFIAQYCALLQPCCRDAGLSTDGATCKALATASAAKGTYNAGKADQCLQETRASKTLCSLGASDNTPSCKLVFGPSETNAGKAPGEACESDGECASSPDGNVSCRHGSFGAANFCQVQAAGKAGDAPCVGTKDGIITSFTWVGTAPQPSRGFVCDLADNLYCAYDGSPPACAPVSGEGGPCRSSRGCTKDLRCDTTARKCVARLAIGDDCSKDSQSCAASAGCDTSTKKCVARLADGEACTSGSACAAGVCSNRRCGWGGTSGSGDASDFGLALFCGGNNSTR